GIRDYKVTGVQTCALPILPRSPVQKSQGAFGRYRFGSSKKSITRTPARSFAACGTPEGMKYSSPAWYARVLPPIVNTRSPETTRSEEHTSELQSPCNLVCR